MPIHGSNYYSPTNYRLYTNQGIIIAYRFGMTGNGALLQERA